MGTCSIGNTTIVSAAEGDFQFIPGIRGRLRSFVPLARAEGVLAKDLGHLGAVHRLSVLYTAAFATLSIANIISRMNTIADSNTPRTLTVPDCGTFNNCILMEPPIITEPPKLGHRNGTKVYAVRVDLIFRQLR